MEEHVCHRTFTITGPQSKVCCTWVRVASHPELWQMKVRENTVHHMISKFPLVAAVISLWQADFFINFFILSSLTWKILLSLQQPVAWSYLHWIDSFCEGSLPFLCSECTTCWFHLCPTHLTLLKTRIFPVYSHHYVLDVLETYHNSSSFFSFPG